MFRGTPVWLSLALIVVGLASTSGDSAPMTYHWEGGMSRYRSQNVIICADGQAICTRELRTDDLETAEIALSPQEIAYYRDLFEHVVALDRATIETFATDVGVTTWSLTTDSETRELTYVFTRDPWARAAERAIHRLVSRAFLLSDARVGSYSPAVYYDLVRDAALTDPEAMREHLRANLTAKVMVQRTPGSQWQTAASVLKQLAYCEPPEMWAGDIMLAYQHANRDLRFALLRAIAEQPFDVGESVLRRDFLVPVMIEGLQWLIDTSTLQRPSPEATLAAALTRALGKTRDRRAVDVLSSDKLWSANEFSSLFSDHALCRMGMPGIMALIEKASSPQYSVSSVARRALRVAAQVYAAHDPAGRRDRKPSPAKVDELRRFLVDRGLGPEGIDAFDIPDPASAAFHLIYPGWSYLPTGDFGGPALEGWGEYEPYKRGPQRCRLDFDGNDLEDIALLVRRDDSIRLVVLLQMPDDQWEARALAEFPTERATQEGYRGLVASIAPIPPTDAIVTAGESRERVLNSPTPGIELRWGEERDVTLFYWADKTS